MDWFKRIAASELVDQPLVRVTNRQGMGLMNNQALDRMRLSDDEENELMELMDYGLRQPRDVPYDAVFFFTEDGFRRHQRLIRLLRKASTGGYAEHRIRFTGVPLWISDDGQVAISKDDYERARAGSHGDKGL